MMDGRQSWVREEGRRNPGKREERSRERKRERERTEVGDDDDDIKRCVCVCVCVYTRMCAIRDRKTREERMARGLLGRVAKEEKIRGLYGGGGG